MARWVCTHWGNIRGLGLRVTLGFYGDNGKENGNYYNGFIRAKGPGSSSGFRV